MTPVQLQIPKKLAGLAEGSGVLLASIGNETGQVLASVLTAWGGSALDRMVAGVMARYLWAGVAPPLLLYVASGCCASGGPSQMQARFGDWPDLHVRLDVGHFLRRLAAGCTTHTHLLALTFTALLSACIFEWDPGDLALLRRAKKRQLQREGMPCPTHAQVDAGISRKELSQYCRRRTRGEEATVGLIEGLLRTLRGAEARDVVGGPLLDEARMAQVWRVQRRHVKCIQDVPGVQLYMETGTTTKGGVVLRRYRCARGSASLAPFHRLLNRVIPGWCVSGL